MAMKSRDRGAIAALRSALGAIANAEAIVVEHAPTSTGGAIAGAVSGAGAGEALRRELSEDDVAAVVAAEIAERRSSADEYEQLGQPEDAGRLRAEADELSAYLSVDDAPPEAT
jgi:uncharacterized protein YqeY